MNLNSPILEIKNLKVSINDNEILKKLNLKIHKGEIHAIMGPNGSGKSTFSKVLSRSSCLFCFKWRYYCLKVQVF
jgi:Fe-S cluster assembly ATP-binding protein